MNDRLVNDPPSAREINPEISTQVQEILYRAMERDPENRFASAKEFAAALAHPEESRDPRPLGAKGTKARAPSSFEKNPVLHHAVDDSGRHFHAALARHSAEVTPSPAVFPLFRIAKTRRITLSACPYFRPIASFRSIGKH